MEKKSLSVKNKMEKAPKYKVGKLTAQKRELFQVTLKHIFTVLCTLKTKRTTRKY